MNWPITDNDIADQIILTEGGYVELSNDKGGPTNRGVTLDTLASWRKKPVTVDDLKAMPIQETRDIYICKYLRSPGFDKLTDIKLRYAMTDFGVLFGPIRATESLQAILKLPQDGAMGDKTITAANQKTDSAALINQLSCARISLHADRVSKDHTQIIFLKGWLARALMFIQ